MGNQDVELTAAIKFETDGPSASGAKKALEDVKAGAEGAAVSVNKIKPAAGDQGRELLRSKVVVLHAPAGARSRWIPRRWPAPRGQ